MTILCLDHKNRRGFTLLEVTFTMLLSGLVTLGLLGVLRNMNKAQRRVEDRMIQDANNQIGNFVMTKLFLDAEGFNYQGSSACGDSGATDFWKLNPSEPNCVLSTGKMNPACTRSLTLEVPDGSTESESFVMTMNVRTLPTGKSPMTMFNPASFYDAGVVTVNSVNDFYVSGSLSFNEASFKNFLTASGMMIPGYAFKMTSPYPARELAAGGLTFNNSIPPRYPAFTFTVSNGSIVTDRPGWLQCQKIFDYSTVVDLDSPGYGFGKLDTAMRLVPAPRAGREGPVTLKAITAVRLSIKRILITGRNRDLNEVDPEGRNPRTGKTMDVLVMSTWSPDACGSAVDCEPGDGDGLAGSFRSRRILVEQVNRVVISRPDIRQASIAFNAVQRMVGQIVKEPE